jgi:L-malate glycosyltransferase
MENILIYFPYNQRTVEQQSVMEMLVNKGNSVFLLTLTSENYLHQFVRTLGVQAFASPVSRTSGMGNIIRNARYLVNFCKQYNIQVILAHQQVAALPLILARPFLKCRVIYVRHNADEDYKTHPLKARIMNRFINRMLPLIVAPSDLVYRYMIEKERVPAGKLIRINYGYNFQQYENPVVQKVSEIKNNFPCRLLLLSIARLVPAKRHDIMFEAVKQLVNKGMDIKMICLGGGMLEPALSKWILANGLQDRIFLKGIQSNVFDYFVAADLLLHLSESEASNSVVKEAGLVNKPVIVCENVGDFSDYIIDGFNGFLVNKEKPLAKTICLLERIYDHEVSLIQIGNELHTTVVKEFDIKNISLQYNQLISNN